MSLAPDAALLPFLALSLACAADASHRYTAEEVDEHRGETIEVVEVSFPIERPLTAGSVLRTAYSMAIDETGSVYVLDRANCRVHVFGSDGDWLRTFGQKGDGPGQLGRSYDIAVAEGRIVVSDFENNRLSVWTTTGTYLRDVRTRFGPVPAQLESLPDGSIVTGHFYRDETDPRLSKMAIARIALLTGELLTYYVDNLPSGTFWHVSGSERVPIPLPVRRGILAVSKLGSIYIASSDRYQVEARGVAGDHLWSLSVPWPNDTWPSWVRDRSAQRLRSLSVEGPIDWPAAPALVSLRVDGHGHLFVFPFDARAMDRRSPVDTVHIFGSDGRMLFSGQIPRIPWLAAHGDHIYGIRGDPASGNQRLTRYKLVEAFPQLR